MSVPEAPMNEYHGTPPRQYDVGLAWQIAPMEPEGKAEGVNELTNGDFRTSVRGPNAAHDF